jgi:RsiW-degrading membrane proteinase PrsW (M82 family)
MNTALLLVSATAPGLALAIYIYYRDKFEKEPMKILVISFLLGILSAVPALIIEIFIGLLPIIQQNVFLHAFFGIALIEEGCKMFFVLIYAYRKKVFNEPFDGITYAVMVSMGFATIENIFYVLEGGAQLAIMRAITAVPAHATFAIIMGYFLGLAKFTHQHKLLYWILALSCSTFLHGAYDYFLLQNSIPGLWIGAIISLITGIYLSKKAIKIHNQNSPFSNQDEFTDQLNN